MNIFYFGQERCPSREGNSRTLHKEIKDMFSPTSCLYLGKASDGINDTCVVYNASIVPMP